MPRADVLLSHAYVLAEDEHERRVMMPYPPLGLLYLSAYLRAQGLAVELHDTTFGSLASFEDHLRAARPRVVGLSVNLMTRQTALRQLRAAREAGAFVAMGGPEPALHAQEYLRRGADVVVEGEGEATLLELVRHVKGRGAAGVENIPGTITLGAGGEVRRAPGRGLLPRLDDLPWPDRAAIDVPRYLAAWRERHGFGSTSLITARGCPFTCTWCSHGVFGLTHRRRSPNDVADEVAFLVERYAPDRLWYADDVFTIHRGSFLGLAAELGRRGLRVPFECISRADRIDEAVADALAAMGCQRLWIGAESGSQRLLDAMQRRTRVEDVQAKTRLLQARGIQVGMFIMLGYEGEEIADLEATVEHLEKAAPDVFLTTVAYPIPGTAYHREVADRLRADGDWETRTDRGLEVAGRRSRRFYEHATRWLVHEVGLAQARRRGQGAWVRGRHWLLARAGQLGMRLTAGEREETGGAAGRGFGEHEAGVRRPA